ncbi:iron-sulfur cluster carrier protein ApbC [Acinetobacter larvae]|uniref:Iron-sulfur cluster carrier protein n=1 Tax=Acinetobacter larvae TaxID=1789224 RepID=A0A1B2LWS8_9GAMM|nr:iron-sulfur cluster carrier protein ApbC [Acinetobacter larvae]AOA57400.1 ATP-binding protein [Acinetobacter larvae]
MSWLASLKSLFSAEVDAQQVQQVLESYRLENSNFVLQQRITQLNIEGRVLQLTLTCFADETQYLQRIHDELALTLKPYGIDELNLHVIQKKATQSSSSSANATPQSTGKAGNIPPVVDATADYQQQLKQAEQPAIAKTAPQQRDIAPHPRIQHVLLVSSGKGGVGKSTTTVNLALALKQLGLKVGVLDADIYGPSIPTMLGNAGQTPMIESEHFVPLDAYGMPVLSIGHLTGDHNTPVAWRGPKATGALMQLFNQTLWPDLDVLVIDMPPGTGDIQLTMAQRIPVTGAIIVTTPQNVALMDATKGIALFNKVQIPVLGVIENMSTHICSNCGFEEQIFGMGGGEQLSAQYHIPLLGRLPLQVNIRENADAGRPSVIAQDDAAEHYLAIAEKIKQQLPLKAKDQHRIF